MKAELLRRIAGMILVGTSAACSDPPEATHEEPMLPLTLIPLPSEVAAGSGYLRLSPSTRIAVAGDASTIAQLLAARLRPVTGWPFEITSDAARSGDIRLELAPESDTGQEGYDLSVSGQGVSMSAQTEAGLFYATQTLRQLLPVAIEASESDPKVVWKIPFVSIRDRPRFAWRGAMLDVARHFFDVATVERLIDLMALHKLNRLHLHLTDDQGWRIQIDAWPKLTQVGGASAVGGGPGGWYTKADYSTIVEYARARFITVVPEIDMPGHTNAALASYGELNESGVPAEPYTGTSVGFSSLWVSGPATSQFVTDVVSEVSALTPGEWLHVGGDEAQSTTPEDYATLLKIAQKAVVDSGKTLVGWEDIASAALTPPFVAQHWREPSRALAAAEQSGKIIASPATHAYLDMKYDLKTPIGTIWAGFVDVESAYVWDPVLEGLAESDVLGVEAPLWTETVDSIEDIDLLMFPRLIGHAEVAWSRAEGRSFAEYRVRLGRYAERLDALGIGYYRDQSIPWQAP